MVKVKKIFLMMLLAFSVMDAYAEDEQFEAQAITWIQLFENKDRLLTLDSDNKCNFLD